MDDYLISSIYYVLNIEKQEVALVMWLLSYISFNLEQFLSISVSWC